MLLLAALYLIAREDLQSPAAQDKGAKRRV
jgi:hypothetical protein